MSEQNAKLEIKIGEIQIQLEGSTDFVSQHYDKIEKQLETLVKISKESAKSSKQHPESSTEHKQNVDNKEQAKEILAKSFGEWLNIIPRDTSDTDKALLAGYYTQLNSDSKTFKSRDVSKLLVEHSIKLSNVSQFVKSLANSKKTFQDSKTGNEANYKVSRATEEELKSLLNL